MAENEKPTSQSKEEYFKSLESWLNEARIWNNLNQSFAFYLISSGGNITNYSATENTSRQNTTQYNHVGAARVDVNEINVHELGPAQAIAIEYVIPPLWKRFVAECIDFIILFFLKLSITFAAIDFFNIIDIEKYDFAKIQNKMDYKKALEMTSDILVLEFIHKVIVCVFETYWIHSNGNREGGATPGKAVMGLRVVCAENIIPIANRLQETVLVAPGTGVNFWVAFIRSIMKNVIIALMFPVCFMLFFFQHNRTGYDILCNTLVVEDTVRRRDWNLEDFNNRLNNRI